jgi:hypothetical protein
MGIKRSPEVGVQVVEVTQQAGRPKYRVNITLDRMQWKSVEVDEALSVGDAIALAVVELKLAGVSLQPN